MLKHPRVNLIEELKDREAKKRDLKRELEEVEEEIKERRDLFNLLPPIEQLDLIDVLLELYPLVKANLYHHRIVIDENEFICDVALYLKHHEQLGSAYYLAENIKDAFFESDVPHRKYYINKFYPKTIYLKVSVVIAEKEANGDNI